MFAYCLNCPTGMSDPSGNFPWIIVAIGSVIVAGIGYLAVEDTLDEAGLNEEEKALVYKDPIAAYNVKEAKEITVEYIDNYYGRENDKDGTQVNAFRHAMWNAIMTDKIGTEKAKEFADAHEAFSNNPDEHKQMDLHNNELGRSIAMQYAGQGYDVFAEKIIEAINNGEGSVLRWDPNAG